MNEAIELLQRGGWLMPPIILVSVAALAFFLERLWSLQRNKILPPRFLEVVSRLLTERRWADAEALCHQNDSPVASVLEAGIRYAGRERDLIKEVMEEAGRQQVYRMERFSGALGSIATVAPLMGLLGTVVGMIRMFQRVVSSADAGASMVNVGLLAEGIWSALMTTAAGLTVAIPTYLAYRFILSRIDRYIVEIEDVALRALELLTAEDEGPTASPRGFASASKAAKASKASKDSKDSKADDGLTEPEAVTT